MTVRIDGAVPAAIRRRPGGIVLLVDAAGATDGARAGLAAAHRDLVLIAKYVSGVLPTPAGAAIFIDGGQSDPQALRRIPQIVVEHLEAAGVTDGVLTIPKPSSHASLDTVPRAVVLWAYGQRRTRQTRTPPIPTRWLELAERWIQQRRSSQGRTLALFYGAEFELGDAGIGDFLMACRRGRVDACQIIHEAPGGRVTGINAQLLGGALALGSAEPTANDGELLGTFEALRQTARLLAPEAAHAYIDLGGPLLRMMSAYAATDWSNSGGELPESVAGLCDELLFDAFPVQILGPGHLARLGEIADATPLDDAGKKVELLYEPSAWLPGADIDAVRAQARDALSACLLGRSESSTIFARRYGPLAP